MPCAVSINFLLPETYSVQRLYPSLYGEYVTCVGKLHSHSFAKHGGVSSVSHQLSSPDRLSSVSQTRSRCCSFVFLLPLFSWFLRYCSSELFPLTHSRVNQHHHSFVPFNNKLWNSLPKSVFPSSYYLNVFKKRNIKTPARLN